jgi:peptide-methionine (S)-S-oxide reductase
MNMKTWLKIVLTVSILGFLVAAYAQKEEKKATTSDKPLAIATFAGGCFWCMEPPYDELDGVISTTSGYTGGKEKNPTYQDVAEGMTGHAEAVQVAYDPAKVSYEKLLEVFWRNIDPFTANAQFCDRGAQYRTAIFYHNEEQQRLAEASKVALEKPGRFNKPIVTEIVPAGEFYVAEEYHQNYYVNNPTRYKYYRYRCGRDARLAEIWGKSQESAAVGH